MVSKSEKKTVVVPFLIYLNKCLLMYISFNYEFSAHSMYPANIKISLLIFYMDIIILVYNKKCFNLSAYISIKMVCLPP